MSRSGTSLLSVSVSRLKRRDAPRALNLILSRFCHHSGKLRPTSHAFLGIEGALGGRSVSS
ncbi:hypothetical protein HYPGJ_20661 [Hyphomicrobium sp. GJ21]|nr:hypothetical protein HYPGJ_20661 [Hyphomicrobium sp. GJ21]